jgi:AcrR family transcriptional regulator
MEPMTADGVGDAPLGLRERSKARRRALIMTTAMRLFAAHGYDSVTVADIAAAAEVAPRTVAGYFPSKGDLALAFAEEVADRIAAAFTTRPGDGFFDIVEDWLVEEERFFDPAMAALAHNMYQANPSLQALSSAHVTRAFEVGIAALVAEVGRPADDPMMVVCSTTVPACLAAYLHTRAEGVATTEFRQAFMAYLRAITDAARPGREGGFIAADGAPAEVS